MKRDLSNMFRWIVCTGAGGIVSLALYLPAAHAQHPTPGTSPLVANGRVSLVAPLGLAFLNGNAMVVAGISDQSPLAGLGLQTGDTIAGINGRSVQSPQDVYSRLATAARSGFPASITINRAGQQTAIDVPTSALNTINQIRLNGLSTLDNQAATGQQNSTTPMPLGTAASGANRGASNQAALGGLGTATTSMPSTAATTSGTATSPTGGVGQTLIPHQSSGRANAPAATGSSGVNAGTTLGAAGLTTVTPASAPVYGGTVPVPPVYGNPTGATTLSSTPIGALGNAALSGTTVAPYGINATAGAAGTSVATETLGTAGTLGTSGTSGTTATGAVGVTGGITTQGQSIGAGTSALGGMAIRPLVQQGMEIRRQLGHERGLNVPGAANTQLGVPGAPLSPTGAASGGAGAASNVAGGALPGAGAGIPGMGSGQAMPGQPRSGVPGAQGTTIPGLGTIGAGGAGGTGVGGGVSGAAGGAGASGGGTASGGAAGGASAGGT